MLRTSFAFVLALSISDAAHAQKPQDDLDRFITQQMEQRQIPGLSLAVIKNGKIIEARAYGTTTRGGSARVTPATLFQGGSISKPVAALAALQLVDAGKLTLDENVNAKLKSWQVPENGFTTSEKVTLRRLLSHSAGLTVHGFPGYLPGTQLLTARQILDGEGNTPAVRVNVLPGSIFRYSGGGFTVMQLLVTDVTGIAFDRYMQDHVLRPLGMISSTYAQPISAEQAAMAATGHHADRTAVPNQFNLYPEQAAAGLWTTASDLARYIIGVQEMIAGRSKLLSQRLAREMVTMQKNPYGLGVGLSLDTGANLRFSHGGRNRGFDASAIGFAHRGDGVVVMINANENGSLMPRIHQFVAHKFRMDGMAPPMRPPVQAVVIAPAALAAVQGRYEHRENSMLGLEARNGRIYPLVDDLPNEEFAPVAPDSFVSTERAASFRVLRNAAGEVETLAWIEGTMSPRQVPRIGPFFSATYESDPDAALTARVMTALNELSQGGDVVRQSSVLTEGARRVFTQANAQLANAHQLSFVHQQDVNRRGMHRHGHAIARVLQYRVRAGDTARNVLIHLDVDGRVADYDIVAR